MPIPFKSVPCRSRSRRGVSMLFTTTALTVVIGFASLGVDVGRVQVVKVEARCAADAAAMAAMDAYAENAYSMTAATAAANASLAANPVDRSSGVSPTVLVEGGTWNATRHSFSTTGGIGTPACRVTVSRTRANGNGVRLAFAGVVGMGTCDARAVAIATLVDNASASLTVPATCNPYLSGMPAGSANGWGDNTTNATPQQMIGVPVVPGTWVSFVNVKGTACIVPGVTGTFGPDGEAARPLHHGQNYNGDDWRIGPENGIADAVLPACALTGYFLSDNAPTGMAAPATVDWTTPARQAATSFADIQLQAPFFIGDGKNPSNVVQRFQVPPGATRLFLGVWDGVTQSNNNGGLTASINLKRSVRLVK